MKMSTEATAIYENGVLRLLTPISLPEQARVRLAILGGMRDAESLLNSALDDSVTWYGIDLDVDLGRSLYLLLSAERSEGDFEEVDQLYATLAFRF